MVKRRYLVVSTAAIVGALLAGPTYAQNTAPGNDNNPNAANGANPNAAPGMENQNPGFPGASPDAGNGVGTVPPAAPGMENGAQNGAQQAPPPAAPNGNPPAAGTAPAAPGIPGAGTAAPAAPANGAAGTNPNGVPANPGTPPGPANGAAPGAVNPGGAVTPPPNAGIPAGANPNTPVNGAPAYVPTGPSRITIIPGAPGQSTRRAPLGANTPAGSTSITETSSGDGGTGTAVNNSSPGSEDVYGTSSDNSLPQTGNDPLPIVTAGAGLLCTGLMIRRRRLRTL